MNDPPFKILNFIPNETEMGNDKHPLWIKISPLNDLRKKIYQIYKTLKQIINA